MFEDPPFARRGDHGARAQALPASAGAQACVQVVPLRAHHQPQRGSGGDRREADPRDRGRHPLPRLRTRTRLRVRDRSPSTCPTRSRLQPMRSAVSWCTVWPGCPRWRSCATGNEVQVYVKYRNHPAFLAPRSVAAAERAAWVDLEYFGVSQYELDHHPDVTVPAVCTLMGTARFRRGAHRHPAARALTTRSGRSIWAT